MSRKLIVDDFVTAKVNLPGVFTPVYSVGLSTFRRVAFSHSIGWTRSVVLLRPARLPLL